MYKDSTFVCILQMSQLCTIYSFICLRVLGKFASFNIYALTHSIFVVPTLHFNVFLFLSMNVFWLSLVNAHPRRPIAYDGVNL